MYPKANATIDRIHQVLHNIVQIYNLHETCVNDIDPQMEILAAAAFAVHFRYHRTKEKIMGELFFSRDTSLPINHISNWRYIRQLKQAQTEKYLICESSTRIDHGYRVRDQIMIRNNKVYKYETLFKFLYKSFQMWKNRTITIQPGAVTYRMNIRHIKPYKTP